MYRPSTLLSLFFLGTGYGSVCGSSLGKVSVCIIEEFDGRLTSTDWGPDLPRSSRGRTGKNEGVGNERTSDSAVTGQCLGSLYIKVFFSCVNLVSLSGRRVFVLCASFFFTTFQDRLLSCICVRFRNVLKTRCNLTGYYIPLPFYALSCVVDSVA